MKVYRKHLFAYVAPLLQFLIMLSALAFALKVKPVTLIRFTPADEATVAVRTLKAWGDPILIGLLALACLWPIYRILVIRSTRITIDEDGVTYAKGVLPWATHDYYWRPFQIFSSSYIQRGFFGWLFSIGSVIITGKEGVTSKFEESAMWRPKACSVDINDLVRG